MKTLLPFLLLGLLAFPLQAEPQKKKIAKSADDDISFALVGRHLHPDVALSYFDFEGGHSPFKGEARSKLLRLDEGKRAGSMKQKLFTFRFTFNLTAGYGNYMGWYFSMKQGAVDFSDKTILSFEMKGTEGIPTEHFQIGIRSDNVPGGENQAKLFLSELGYEKFPTDYTLVTIPIEMLEDREPGLEMARLNDLLVFGFTNPEEEIVDQHVWIRNAHWSWDLSQDDEGLHVNLSNLEFDTAKADIKPGMLLTLNKLVKLLKREEGKKVLIDGHTDNQGKRGYNQKLSERRANSVKNYLVKEGGFDKRLFSAKGYGPDKPIAENDTAEGRAKNRRVELTIKNK